MTTVDGRRAFEDALQRDRAVAVVRAPQYGDGAAIAAGLAEGGIGTVEFTLTGANALEAIERAAEVPGAFVGAGSVRSVEQGRRAVDAGARFLVSPARVAALAHADLGVPVVLAGWTPTELVEAFALTGGPVKLFPVSTGGLAHLKAVAAPLPDVPLLPSGGIDAGNAAAYLAAGAVAVNLGSSLCHVPAVVDGDAAELRRRAQLVRDAIDRGPDGEVAG
ncbi:2-dehydro-3-deoxyphosphogluconate aldolase [Nitriliruptoraceae bacterium ZYF776]|nr:2-dehydro-3-deoxyphosphogluconate aldolase [Profundirhabdus halotolerans]